MGWRLKIHKGIRCFSVNDLQIGYPELSAVFPDQCHSLFLLFPEMSMEQAAYLLDYADRNWSDVKGTFVESLGR